MTSINGVGGSAPTSIQQIFQQARATQTKLAPLSQLAQQSTATSPLQEANETPAQTQLEAARGDQVAIRKLAHEKQREQFFAGNQTQSKGGLFNRTV